MKTALILVAVVAYAAAASIDPNDERSLSSAAADGLLSAQKQMPCGFPRLGIPPLAPLMIPQRAVNVDTPALKVKGSVENFKLNGLNDYKIEKLSINPLTRKVAFQFKFENVNFDTDYDLDAIVKKAGFTIHLVGRGKAKFAVKDIEVWGNLKYSLNILTGKVKLKSLEARTRIDDVDSKIEGILGDGKINGKMNDVLEEAVQVGVNANEDYISELIGTYGLLIINKYLDTVTLSDLSGALGRGDGEEREACVPPSP